MQTDYSEIIQAYPPVITLEQLYQICHISKRKAKWLLETGRIPCQDSGKKTRRFKIRTEDVVAYLIDQASNPEKYRAQVGMFNSNKKDTQLQNTIPRTRYFVIDASSYHAYISNLWRDLPDALTTSEIQACTGISRSAILRWIGKSEVESTSKESVINHVVRLTLNEPHRLSLKLITVAMAYSKKI